MKHASRYFLGSLVLLLGFSSLVACGGNNTKESIESSAEPIKTENSVKPTKTKILEHDYVRMVMVKGQLYQDTGYVDSLIGCGTPDGTIVTTVGKTAKPKIDDQSNFGKGYDYQLADNSHIRVSIDNRWVIFQNLAISSLQIPDSVAHFSAEITKVSDGTLLIDLTAVPKQFSWIFRNQEIAKIKPISLPIKNLADKPVINEELLGKKVEIWFDGSIKNTESEQSQSIELGKVYKIKVVK